MQIELPDADVVDRITILEIKADRLTGEAQGHAFTELKTLREAWNDAHLLPMTQLPELERLREVNTALWDVEQTLRDLEQEQRFDTHFIEQARSVYHLNDERALLKRAINQQTGSRLVEQKSYV